MIGHRCSSLPIAQFCGLAPALGAKHGSGRSAAMSSAFHAKAAQEDGWENKWARLTDKEQAIVGKWKTPTDIQLGSTVLKYEDAVKEAPLGLSADGTYVERDDPNAVTAGTADMYWVVDDTLYLADMKRSIWTESNPLNNQNLAYAFAAASKHRCSKMWTGLWHPEEGQWGPWSDCISLVSQEALTLLKRVLAAATNLSEEPCIGDHCNNCYSRKHCPEYMLPPAVLRKESSTILCQIADQKGELTMGQALTLRRLYERGKELLEAIEPVVKAYARENGGIRDEEAGRVWTEISKKGSKRPNLKLIKEKYPDVAAECTVQGAPTKAFVWKKL